MVLNTNIRTRQDTHRVCDNQQKLYKKNKTIYIYVFFFSVRTEMKHASNRLTRTEKSLYKYAYRYSPISYAKAW